MCKRVYKVTSQHPTLSQGMLIMALTKQLHSTKVKELKFSELKGSGWGHSARGRASLKPKPGLSSSSSPSASACLEYQFPWECESLSRVPLFATPWTVAHQAPLSWDSPGKNNGVGYYALLQGIFPTQGLNPGPLQGRQILYSLSHQGSPQLPWNVDPKARRLLFDHLRLSCNFWEALAMALQALSNYPKKPSAPRAVIKASHWHSLQSLITCCCCSVTKSCLTLHTPVDCSTSGFPVPHHLPEFAQVHVCCIVITTI